MSDVSRPLPIEDTLVPLDTLAARFRVHRATLNRWLIADNIPTFEIPGERATRGRRPRAARWGDILTASARNTPRWQQPNPGIQ